MSDAIVRKVLMSQVEFNLALMDTLLAIFDATPVAAESRDVREKMIELSRKNGAIIERLEELVATGGQGENNGR